MPQYFKGKVKTDDGSGTRVTIEIFDNPQPDPFDEDKLNVAQVIFLNDGHNNQISDLKDLESKFYIEREISGPEMSFLYLTAMIQTEVFMNQYTGGFPNDRKVTKMIHDLSNLYSIVRDRQCEV